MVGLTRAHRLSVTTFFAVVVGVRRLGGAARGAAWDAPRRRRTMPAAVVIVLVARLDTRRGDPAFADSRELRGEIRALLPERAYGPPRWRSPIGTHLG